MRCFPLSLAYTQSQPSRKNRDSSGSVGNPISATKPFVQQQKKQKNSTGTSHTAVTEPPRSNTSTPPNSTSRHAGTTTPFLHLHTTYITIQELCEQASVALALRWGKGWISTYLLNLVIMSSCLSMRLTLSCGWCPWFVYFFLSGRAKFESMHVFCVYISGLCVWRGCCSHSDVVTLSPTPGALTRGSLLVRTEHFTYSQSSIGRTLWSDVIGWSKSLCSRTRSRRNNLSTHLLDTNNPLALLILSCCEFMRSMFWLIQIDFTNTRTSVWWVEIIMKPARSYWRSVSDYLYYSTARVFAVFFRLWEMHNRKQ